ncbi:MAG: MFS transporter [Planctomycetota bacterium]
MTHATAGRPAAIAWILLDWAASAFSAILITLVVAYVERVVFADAAWGVDGGVVWAWIMAAAMLASALLAPFLSAHADRTHSHKRWLLIATAVGAGACLGLAAVPPAARLAVAAAIVIAAVGFDMAQIFTGSLLPRIAQGADADRLSAAGFGAGYLGGALALILATAVVSNRDALGLSAPNALRWSFVVMGGWWLLFSLPAAFARLGDGRSADHAATSAGELMSFARSLAGDAADGLGRTLLGSVLVLGAVQTAIAQFSSLALEEFHLDSAALVRLVLLVQFVALPGALFMGWLSTRWSRAGALAGCLAGWIAVIVLAWFVRTPGQLTALAVLLALVLGGVQSVVRATIAGLAPPGRFGATFGLLQVGTKLAGFVASLLFGAAYAATGNARSGLVVLLAQLLAGWLVLRK